MSYAIVYSSRTGNTELLARAIQSALPAEDCLYFGGPDAAVLKRVQANLGQGCTLVGSYMCQGKMPQAVRRRYEAMLAAPDHAPNLEAMIEDFDHALSHPDTADLDGLTKAVLAAGRE